jgi:hypothetical protein
MVKLLLCLFSSFAIGLAALQLRQQQRELGHRTASLQQKIEGQQARLWSQQLQIAIYTAPNAISSTVGQHALDLTPETPAGESIQWLSLDPNHTAR